MKMVSILLAIFLFKIQNRKINHPYIQYVIENNEQILLL